MAPGKECNAGLHLINKNLTADGSGRDRMMFFDSGYRGGRNLMNDYPMHKNHVCSAPYAHSPPMDVYWNKFQLRPYDNSSRTASMTRNLASLKESRAAGILSMPNLPSQEYLFPKAPAAPEFMRTRGTMSTGTLKLPREPEPPAPEPPKKFDFGKGDAHRHQYTGISRTPYGGYWRTMSMTGPG